MPHRTLREEKKSGNRPERPEEKVEETVPERPAPERPETVVDTNEDESTPAAGEPRAEPLIAMGPTGPRGKGVIGDRSEGGREEGMARHGGTLAAENAVGAALRWLAAHQDDDGKWDADGFTRHCPAGRVCGGASPRGREGIYDVGISGLALLCFLGHGNTHQAGEHREVVGRALAWLLSRQDRRSGAFEEDRPVAMYNQAIATLALAEVYAMSDDAKLRPPLVRAVNCICQAQQKSGGWDYTAMKTDRNDTSVTGWQVMALKSAKSAGVHIPWRTTHGILRHFERVTDEQGYVGYTNGRVSRANIALAAVGMLSNRYLGRKGDDPLLVRQQRILLANLPRWPLLRSRRGRDHSMYYWYYGTLAMYQQGGRAWDTWNEAIRDMLVTEQCHEGHAAGSWDPDGFWARQYAGRVYSTALMTLTLEIYYRYLPMYESTDTLGSGSVLVQLVRGETDTAERVAAIHKLVMFNDPEIPKLMQELLSDEDPAVRFAAARVLAERGDPAAIPAVAAGLDDGNAFIRFNAIRTLEKLDHPDTIAALIDALDDTVPGNANVAARALQRKTGQRFGFDATTDPAERRKIIETWRTWWKNNEQRFRRLPDVRAEVVNVRDSGKRVLVRLRETDEPDVPMPLRVYRAGNLVGRVLLVEVLPGHLAECTVTWWRYDGDTISRGDVVSSREPGKE
jgi:hypothetical protein